ncbi:hypothetical protein ACP275_14G147800 [Erythranthe tilingii]
MGGCFSSSENLQLQQTPVYYYYPPVSEEHAPSTKLDSPKKVQLIELMKSKSLTVSVTDEEDVCPTCLEEYDSENPKITTKCNHHFHLSCILEWMERSDTCPICDQEMKYESPFPTQS